MRYRTGDFFSHYFVILGNPQIMKELDTAWFAAQGGAPRIARWRMTKFSLGDSPQRRCERKILTPIKAEIFFAVAEHESVDGYAGAMKLSLSAAALLPPGGDHGHLKNLKL